MGSQITIYRRIQRTMKKKEQNTRFLTAKEGKESSQWLEIDADGKVLGRFASEIAKILRGKHKPSFSPHIDSGDGVIILNAEKIRVTGAKEAQKIYRYYTGAVGGLREIPYRVMMEKKPEEILRHAIKKMMPKNRLANAQLKRLRIYKGGEHNMQAQKPIQVEI